MQFPNRGGNRTTVSDHGPDVPGNQTGDHWVQIVNGTVVSEWIWDGTEWRTHL